MRSTFATLALAALTAASPVPQGVTSAITPSSSPPAGCSGDYSGTFEIQVVNVTSSGKRSIEKRQHTALVISLSGGVLHDSQGRTGYIAANQQFQFDNPPQTGAIYTAGFSVCGNGSLAIGGDAVWYQCLSGTFYNLYDSNSAAQCSPVYIQAIGGASGGSSTVVASVTSVTTSAVASQQSDGQVTATPVSSAGAVTQISDGQIQATTATPVTQISDGQIQATTGAPVTQISDGQIQATTGAPVTQISDGQIQATTGAACTEYVDGQPQCSSAVAPVTTVAPCTQIVDGQPQCPSSGIPVPSYGANTTIASPTVSAIPATGAGATAGVGHQVFGLAAGVLAVALL